MVHHREGVLDHVFVWLTRIGSYGAVWVALAIVLALVRRRWELLVLVWHEIQHLFGL